MSSLHNQVQLLGRAGETPVLSLLTDGTAVTRLRLYQRRTPNEQTQGNDRSVAEQFRLVAWESTARRLTERVRRGQEILVRGRLRNRQFKRDGITHVRTEVHVDQFHILDRTEKELLHGYHNESEDRTLL